MTDLEQIEQILARAEVCYFECKSYMPEGEASRAPTIELWIEEGQVPNNLGYIGFSTGMAFDLAGNLRSVGAWE